MPEHRVRTESGISVIDVAASYSRSTFLGLLDVVKGLTAKGKHDIVINMSGLEHINSEGIGLLVMVHDNCERGGGRMVLCSVPSRVERVLRLAGVATFFKIHPDEKEAVDAVASAAKARDAEADAKAEATAAGTVSRAEQMSPEDLADAAREIVRTMVRSRRHHEAIQFFNKRTVKAASLDEVAASLGIPRLTAEHVLRDLARNEVVVEDGQAFIWSPSAEAEERLDIFRKALSAPRLRSRLMAWLYAEAKK